MMKTIFAAAIAAAVLLMSGCATGPQVVSGYWFSDQSGPIIATGQHSPSKVGTASAHSVLGLVGTGDASISAAMRNGGITQIHHVDFHTKSIFGIIADTQIMVYGD